MKQQRPNRSALVVQTSYFVNTCQQNGYFITSVLITIDNFFRYQKSVLNLRNNKCMYVKNFFFFCLLPHWICLLRIYVLCYDTFPTGNYMLKVNNRNAGTRCKICSKLTTKIQKQRHRRRSCICIVNFEHISHLALVFLSLTSSKTPHEFCSK